MVRVVVEISADFESLPRLLPIRHNPSAVAELALPDVIRVAAVHLESAPSWLRLGVVVVVEIPFIMGVIMGVEGDVDRDTDQSHPERPASVVLLDERGCSGQASDFKLHLRSLLLADCPHCEQCWESKKWHYGVGDLGRQLTV